MLSSITGKSARRGFATVKQYTTEEALSVLSNHFSPAVPRAPKGNDIVYKSGKGSWITSVEDKEYLDLQTGIAVGSTGHCHPKVVAAVQEQAANGFHLQQNCMISQPMVRLLEKMNEVTPKEISRFFFNVTGSEAVESAVKLARHETGRQDVIVFQGSFHGRSLGTMAMTTSKNVYRAGYGPLPSGIHVAKYPSTLYMRNSDGSRVSEEFATADALASLEAMFKGQVAPNDVAAIVIETILGEGGYLTAPKGFLRGLRSICDKYGIKLVFDEVQAGVGRTGKMWAFEHDDVIPDIFVFAKGIASGVPLSGIATRGDLMFKSTPGSMGGTYGATAISCSAALATLNVIQEEKLVDNAAARGAQLSNGLKKLQQKYPQHIAEVRGKGCMVGFEFAHPVGSGIAGAVTHAAMNEGLLLLTTGWREVIRFIPALVITEEEVNIALEKFERALDKTLPNWSASQPILM